MIDTKKKDFNIKKIIGIYKKNKIFYSLLIIEFIPMCYETRLKKEIKTIMMTNPTMCLNNIKV